jgi:hypothetical protein
VGLNRFCRETDNQEILEVLEEQKKIKEEKLDKKALDTSLECPICTEEMKPPRKIFQCSNGHVICELCKINPQVVILYILCSVTEVHTDLDKD